MILYKYFTSATVCFINLCFKVFDEYLKQISVWCLEAPFFSTKNRVVSKLYSTVFKEQDKLDPLILTFSCLT